MDPGTSIAIGAVVIAAIAAGISLSQTIIAKGQAAIAKEQLEVLTQQVAEAKQDRNKVEEAEQREIVLDIWRKAEKVIENHQILIEDHKARPFLFVTALPLISETRKLRDKWYDTVMIDSVKIENEKAKRVIKEVRVILDEIVHQFRGIIRQSPVLRRKDRIKQCEEVETKLARAQRLQKELYGAVTAES